MASISKIPSWLFSGLVVTTIVLGSSILHALRDAPPAPKAVEQPVQAAPLVQESELVVKRLFAAVVEPQQQATLAFERHGTIDHIAVQEGDNVSKNQLLAKLNDRQLQAQRQSLQASVTRIDAELKLAERIERRQKQLQNSNYNSANDYDQALAKVDALKAQRSEALARLSALNVDIERTSLRAPFDGKVVSKRGDSASFISANQPVLILTKDNAARIRVGVPANAIDSMPPGTTVSIQTQTGLYEGRVTQLGSSIDQQSRTVQLFIEPSEESRLVYGEAVSVVFEQAKPITGYWVESRALISGPRGTWQIRALKPNSTKPELLSINVIELQGNRAFISGDLKNYSKVITAGNHKLAPKQPIKLSSEH